MRLCTAVSPSSRKVPAIYSHATSTSAGAAKTVGRTFANNGSVATDLALAAGRGDNVAALFAELGTRRHRLVMKLTSKNFILFLFFIFYLLRTHLIQIA